MNWNHIFEWYLKKSLDARVEMIKAQKRKRSSPVDLKPDLNNLHLAYNSQGSLALADVKPAGFLVRSKG